MPEEGLAVVDVMNHAQIKWEGEYEFEVTVRIGSHQSTDGLKPLLDEIRQHEALDRESTSPATHSNSPS